MNILAFSPVYIHPVKVKIRPVHQASKGAIFFAVRGISKLVIKTRPVDHVCSNALPIFSLFFIRHHNSVCIEQINNLSGKSNGRLIVKLTVRHTIYP
ncbi:hypothetical protein [Providencia rettgeri]|uniref:hypothetical protein n=1 Tax=Providencia rettgeri TaxID=587 RepID=UPI0034E09CA3